MSIELLIIGTRGTARDVIQLARIIFPAGLVKLAEECRLGMGTQILKDLTIADRVIEGTGSEVTRSLTTEGIYLGAPAKLKTC